MSKAAHVVVIGGGIVGLATAYQVLKRDPTVRLTLLEKEDGVAAHQSGHNSGVLHTGIYYRPGSVKALTCTKGKRLMESFCAAEGIDYRITGKLIVATTADELPRLETLANRAEANGVSCEVLEPEMFRRIEPHLAGLRALHVKEAGVVDYRTVCLVLAEKLREMGAVILTGARVVGYQERPGDVLVRSSDAEIAGSVLVNCGGLFSDRLLRMSGREPEVRIVPFRGEYYKLRDSVRDLCRTLIYPVPDPAFPFLGVHFTRRISGEVECGPNAVLALSREGYRKSQFSLRDTFETLGFRGFRRLARRYWRTGLDEMIRSYSKAAFVTALQRLVPDVRESDLETAPAGVRAQAVTPEGEMVDDFCFADTPRTIHVLNAPSPAATASLAIGARISAHLEERLPIA